jgi:hypothetical protein
MIRALSPLVLALAAFGLACGPTNASDGQPGGNNGNHDGSPADDAVVLDAPGGQHQDASQPVDDSGQPPNDGTVGSCTNPVGDNCGGTEICGNGLDDNCDGQVDEGCTCVPGQVQPCFAGHPGRRNVGMCQDGTQRCIGDQEFGTWGPCEGGILPSAEVCDTQDNDCNGCADDDPSCWEVPIQCPNSMPEATPYNDYTINGADFYPGTAQSWSWKVEGGPCDRLLWQTSQATSYTLQGPTGAAQHTTVIAGTNTSSLKFHPTLSGDYTVTMGVTTVGGNSLFCTFLVHVKGPGFRTELCWDTTGDTDIDLHIHRPGSTTPWFTKDGTNDTTSTNLNDDDCSYVVCQAGDLVADPNSVNWGYANTSVDNCKGAPAGQTWVQAGYCHNPRLDIDNQIDPGKPENINIDNPNNGDKFRVMVHFFGGNNVETHPMVNVYCGGNLLATYGADPDTVSGFNTAAGFALGQVWRVVDVTTQVSGGVTTGCTFDPLHPSGSTSGYWVTNNVTSY